MPAIAWKPKTPALDQIRRELVGRRIVWVDGRDSYDAVADVTAIVFDDGTVLRMSWPSGWDGIDCVGVRFERKC